MPRHGNDDQEAIDRAFAELVAGYHRTAEPPDHPVAAASAEAGTVEPVALPEEPAFVFDLGLEHGRPPSRTEEPIEFDDDDEPYVPEPLPPLRRPAAPVLIGSVCLGYAVIAVLGSIFGLRLPVWAGWLAVVSFVGGFGLLVSQLPRQRPPDAGNGAVI